METYPLENEFSAISGDLPETKNRGQSYLTHMDWEKDESDFQQEQRNSCTTARGMNAGQAETLITIRILIANFYECFMWIYSFKVSTKLLQKLVLVEYMN